MKNVAAWVVLSLSLAPLAALADCDSIKAAIDGKLKAKNISAYTLEVRDAADASDGKVVGNCEGGKKVIVYKKGTAADKPAEAKTAAATN